MSERAAVDERTVRIERPATGGAVARLDDGRVVFVRHALPGELVVVGLTEVTSRYARADALRVIEPSPQRVSAPCPYAAPGLCGGCDLQHASSAAQVEWKRAVATEHLARLAHLDVDLDVEAAPSPAARSRTRLRCAVDPEGRLGLYRSRSHDVVALDDCWIADQRVTPAFGARWRGALEVELRAIGDGEAFAVVTRPDGSRETTTLGNEPRSAVASRVAVGDHRFTVSPGSFWQAHRDAPTVLSDAVRELAQLERGDAAVDLYSGVGLFTVALARAVGPDGRVTAVESSPDSAADALDNVRAMGRVRVRQWPVAPRAVYDVVGEGDVVVVDPPRTGLGRGVAAALARRRPRRVVYVSCDAATFARDLGELVAGGYELARLRAFDLFPMTEHLELVALLDRVA
ncbi:MAG: class I SAM-dependent RNA methyltransferase [Acidimicrobiales bacterium]